jgi:DNA polymerase III alpha subunit (gram-positive type)
MELIFDLECDGLREEATKIWCIVTKDIETKEVCFYTPKEIERGLKHLMEAKRLIGHNIISYDLPVIKRLHGKEYKGEVYDTLVVSRVLNPDRGGGHSLDAWGRRVGRDKPKHDEWDRFTKEMLHRCKEDVEINLIMYYELLREIRRGG